MFSHYNYVSSFKPVFLNLIMCQLVVIRFALHLFFSSSQRDCAQKKIVFYTETIKEISDLLYQACLMADKYCLDYQKIILPKHSTLRQSLTKILSFFNRNDIFAYNGMVCGKRINIFPLTKYQMLQLYGKKSRILQKILK